MRVSKPFITAMFSFLAFFSILIPVLSFMPNRASAYTSPNEDGVEKQLQRTLLYAFGACLSLDTLKDGISDEDINNHKIFTESVGNKGQIGVGHEITANHEENDGTISCNNDLIYSQGLKYVAQSWASVRDKLYEARNGSWYLKPNGKEDVDKLLQDLREPKRYTKDSAIGPQERKRRLAVAVSRCIEPIPDGQVAADSITINGVKYKQIKDGDDRVSVGHDMQPDGSYQCGTLINLAKSENVLDGVDLAKLRQNSAFLAAPGDTKNEVIGNSQPSGTAAKEDACESTGALGWIVCPVLEILSDALVWFDLQIKNNLEADQPTDQIQESWSRVRNLALILLVPIMLVMVISTALGFDFIDAYTVKRTLPRLAIAVILISLSFPLLKFAIDIFNTIGQGVQGIMLSPWPGANAKKLADYISPGQGAVAIFGGAVALTLGFGVLFPLLLSAALGLLLAFIVLGIRRVLLLLLIILAPLAIVSWILPGTEKFWKLWWTNFSKLLFMFPLIMALLAAGKIGAEMLGEADTGVDFFLVMVALVVPYFLITTTFKAGGAFFGALSGAAMGSVSGARKYLRGRSGAALKQRGQDLRNANYFKGGKETGFRASLNKGLQGASYAGRAGINPTKWKGNIGRAVELNAKQQRDAMLEDEEYADWKMNDTLNKEGAAARNSGDLRRRLQALQASGAYTGNIDRDVARYERLSRKYGDTAFRQRSVLQAIAGGTAYGSSVEALEALAQAGGGDRASEADMISEARKSAMNAGRVDQGGNSFGKTIANVQAIQQLQAQRDSGAIDEAGYQAGLEQIRQKQNKEVLEAQGPDVITHSSVKSSAMKELIPQFKERVQAAYASGNQEEVDRELAIAASVYDGLARSNPEKARIFGDEVMLWDPTLPEGDQRLPVGVSGPITSTPKQSLQQRVEARRGSEVFQSTRREYESRSAAERSGGPSEPGLPDGTPLM